MNEMAAWKKFEETGSVSAYIEYREVQVMLSSGYGEVGSYASEDKRHCSYAEKSGRE